MNCKSTLLMLATIALGAVGLSVAQEQQIAPAEPAGNQTERIVPVPGGPAIPAPAAPVPATAAPAAGTHGSQYRSLLKEIEVPEDRQRYGDFYNYGYWPGTEYAGQKDLPPGYWVYLAPKWYIFKDDVTGQGSVTSLTPSLTPRPWGPEQATGAPDTWPNSGDLGTAWASATPDGQREWLELTYKDAVRPAAVLIYETFNPGAVDRITTYDANGKEVELWSGADPTPAGSEKGISVISLHPDFDLTRIRIYLDSPKVAGWNEIDAVGLLDAAGTTHWAASATASSSYADQTSGEVAPGVVRELREREKLDALSQFQDATSK